MTKFQKFYWFYFAIAMTVSASGIVLYAFTGIYAVGAAGIAMLFGAAALGTHYWGATHLP